MLKLLDTGVGSGSSIVLIVDEWVVGTCQHGVIFLIEYSHRGDLFVNRLHEFTEAFEVEAELLDELTAILFEVDIEKLVSDWLNLVGESFLCFSCGLTWRPILRLEALREHVLFQVDNIHNLFLEMSEAVS